MSDEAAAFLYDEAALLDARRYEDWLALLTDDVRYRVSALAVRELGEQPQTYAILDEDAATLRRRILQIGNPRLTYTENPPSFTRRFVSNVRARVEPDGLAVTSYVLLYRKGVAMTEAVLYAGVREDRIRRTAEGLRLAARAVVLDTDVIPTHNLSTLL
jgi:3-phenylpropionate/cinnamic acid dioxygenase small subunit